MTRRNQRFHVLAIAAFAHTAVFAVAGVPASGSISVDGAHPGEVAVIIDGYIEATGGAAAYAKLYNRVSNERIIHVGMGFEDKAVLYAAMPAKRSTTIESDAFGTTRSGTNGEVAWYLSDRTGPIVFEGETLASELHAAVFDRWSKWRTLYTKSELVGEVDVDGKLCHKVVMTPLAGPEEVYYFDKQSKLLVKLEKQRLFPGMPPLPVTAELSDYREVDGILVPHQVAQVMTQCGSKREMTFVTESISFNVEMAADQFDPPAEVQLAAKTSLIAEAIDAVLSPGGGEKSRGSPCGGKKAESGDEKSENSPCCGKKKESGGEESSASPCCGKKAESGGEESSASPCCGKKAESGAEESSASPCCGKKAESGGEKTASAPSGGKKAESTRAPCGGK